MKQPFTKRGRLDIICEVLTVCRKPARKTSILYGCNLSYNQLQKYLEYLITQGLLSLNKIEGMKLYHITDIGKEFLEGYARLERFLEIKQINSTVIREIKE